MNSHSFGCWWQGCGFESLPVQTPDALWCRCRWPYWSSRWKPSMWIILWLKTYPCHFSYFMPNLNKFLSKYSVFSKGTLLLEHNGCQILFFFFPLCIPPPSFEVLFWCNAMRQKCSQMSSFFHQCLLTALIVSGGMSIKCPAHLLKTARERGRDGASVTSAMNV